MSLLKRFIKRGAKESEVFEKAPALRQMMKDLEREEKELIEKMEIIMPLISSNVKGDDDETTPEGIDQHHSDSTSPVSFPVNFDDDLAINLCLGSDRRQELLLNRHVAVAGDKITPDQMVGKAYSNLFRQIENSISISMIDEGMGMVAGCDGFEACMVMINEIWALIRKQVMSDEIVFAIPAHNSFLFTAAHRKETIERLNHKIGEITDDPSHPGKLSRRLYVMHKDGATEIYNPGLE